MHNINVIEKVEARAHANMAYKVASLIESKLGFNPASIRDSISTGIPVSALIGALAGGAYGLTENPGYDEETGERKSAIKNALKSAIIGAGIGTVGAAALPGIASAALYGSGTLQRNVIAPVYDVLGGKAKPGLFSKGISSGDSVRGKGAIAQLASIYGGNTNQMDTSKYLELLNPLM